jgi:diadenosine tetraphosphate (Ap4A) HIT family hydrolase
MNCLFCNRDTIKKSAPIDGDVKECERWIYDYNNCYAVLKPEQHTIGECLVIPYKHRTDITDDLSADELSDFIKTINTVAKRIKNIARNEKQLPPDRIYVGILCDGVDIQHLHAHLIPRYPFGEYENNKYRELFTQRDGEISIWNKIRKCDLGGYWYISDKEQNHYKSDFGKKKTMEKVHFLEDLARQLRFQ